MSDDAEALMRQAAQKYADWSDEDLEGELALRKDQGEDYEDIGLAIIARGGNPMPTPEEQNVHYEARRALRGE